MRVCPSAALGAQGLNFEVVDQPRAAKPRRSQHDQSVASVGYLQVRLAAHGHVVGLQAFCAQGFHGVGF